ncbi:MAG: autotransporter domain-containing protein [Alphaproteobacteria bacterium]|nr:autotransporter domain-containing protein [Alphaproteobacteria bacterium]
MSVSAGAVLFNYGGTARAQTVTPTPQCQISGTTVTCTGDLSAGVVGTGPPLTSLTINNLTTAIAPAAGVQGVDVDIAGDGDTTVTVDTTGTTGINTDGGPDADGINVNVSGSGTITIFSTADITSLTANGIVASVGVNGDIILTSIGDIQSSIDGINATVAGDGNVTVDSTGNITPNSDGIETSVSGNGDISITSEGDIIANERGLSARVHGAGSDNDIVIDTTGTIESVERGISSRVDGDGTITITSNGDITSSAEDAIFSQIDGTGTINITVNGNVTASAADTNGVYVALGAGSTSTVDMTDGTAQGGSGTGAGVKFDGATGSTHVLNTMGAVTLLSDAGYAVSGGLGNATINNYGILDTTTNGIVDLGAGTNAFNNMEGATFNSGASVILAAGNLFTNAGDLSPGGSGAVQTTTLTGDFLNTSTGSFTVTIDETAATPNDQLVVSGSATLEGGTVSVTGVNYAPTATYTILAATSVTNTFDDVIDTLFIDWLLTHNAASVELSATATGDNFCEFAATANQRAVACGGLDNLSIDSDLAQAVLGATTAADAQTAYDALSGELTSSLESALIQNSQAMIAAINARMSARFGDPGTASSTAAFGSLSKLADGGNDFWISGYGSWADTDATANTAQMDNNLGGVVLGVDRAVADRWRIGVLGGYSQSNVTLSARSSFGSADSWSLGLYGGAETGASGISFGGLYNWHSIDTSRTASFAGFSQNLSANYNAQSWQLFAEARHRLQVRDLTVEPFAGISHVSLDTDGFSETGGVAALTVASDTLHTTFTTIGLRTSMDLRDKVRTRGMVGWRHTFGDTDPISTVTLSGSSPFNVSGAPIAQDALVTDFGFEVDVSDKATFDLGYSGQYGDGTTAHGFNASFTARF